jgi:lysozyme family protein
MTTTFDLAQAFTEPAEGGLVDHPKDPGGLTNLGVSLRFLKDEGIDIDGDGVISRADIYAMTPEKAKAVFRRAFWDKLQLDLLKPRTAIALYDSAVNTGRTQAVKFLQRAARVKDDGILGNGTRAAADKTDDADLSQGLLTQREAFHQLLAVNSPYPDGRDYRPFLNGWLHRCRKLRAYLQSVEV